jgi:hypothetical protein
MILHALPCEYLWIVRVEIVSDLEFQLVGNSSRFVPGWIIFRHLLKRVYVPEKGPLSVELIDANILLFKRAERILSELLDLGVGF